MMNKMQLLNSMLYKSGILPLMQSMMNSKTLIILAYHRIYNAGAYFPFDNDLISATPEQFEQQLRFISANGFTVIDFHDLREIMHSKEIKGNRYAVITFDDGFEDNYTFAFPLLRKFGMKAVIFLVTDCIDSTIPFWFDRFAFYYKQGLIKACHFPVGSEPPVENMPLVDLLSFMKTIPNQIRLGIMDNLDRENIELFDDETIGGLSRPLSWAQIREMNEHGIEFGSHTCSHPAIPMLTEDSTVEQEIAGSKHVIESEIGTRVVSFSYPIGAASPLAMFYVKKHGYEFAVDYYHSKNKLTRHFNPFALHRLHMETSLSYDEYRISMIT